METIQLATFREITEGELSRIRKLGSVVSVYDVIRAVTGQSLGTCRKTWQRLTETHPELVAICTPYKFNKTGRGSHQESAGADASGITTVLMVLPGHAAAEFRKSAARVVVRYLGGDTGLVDEIAANRAAQERLAQHGPDHPARLFGEAVERQGCEEGRMLELKRKRLEVNDMELKQLILLRDTLAASRGGLDDAQEWLFRDRLSNLLRDGGAGCLAQPEQQQTTHAGQFLIDQGVAASVVRKVRSLFGKFAAELKRKSEGLESNAELPKELKRCDGTATSVVVYKTPQELPLLERAFERLVATQVYMAAVAATRPRR